MIKKLNRLINKIEIVLGREKLISVPYSVQIEPTNRCNQKCIMCPRNEPDYNIPWGDLSLENFKKILEQLPGTTDMLLNGLGEPLINKDLPAMIKYASHQGINVGINSNCALITRELAEKLGVLTLTKGELVSIQNMYRQQYSAVFDP